MLFQERHRQKSYLFRALLISSMLALSLSVGSGIESEAMIQRPMKVPENDRWLPSMSEMMLLLQQAANTSAQMTSWN